MTYEYTKNWRQRTKANLVAALGGKCCVCGYSRCVASLDLHHKDKSQKDKTISDMLARPTSITKIIEEAKKCCLLCKNCHGEYHYGLIPIPDNSPSLDTSVFETSCKNIPTVKPKRVLPDKEILQRQIVELGYAATGRIYGVTDNAVRKWIKKLQVGV